MGCLASVTDRRRQTAGLRMAKSQSRRDLSPCRPVTGQRSRPAALRSVSSIRVCQPGPPARKWSKTSGLSRIVVLIFGLSDLGRPRCTGALAKAACHSGADRSGTSSSKSRGIGFLFSVIGFPHADDAAGAVARGPGENHHPAA